ncbi:MAG: cysteine--tRNA ligase [Christensenellaceae bacterium]|jgi:cysteinyl-tRNA synthetase|nr:cysteine--tRNA ligase [Christensenellaceae bacterium]
MKLFNTMTRQKEEFKPLKGDNVRVYSCGPTVYNNASIGNLRAYVFTDVLKRTLEFAGYKVFDVMNLTDVGHLVSDGDEGEDKIEKSARAQNTTPQAIAERYTKQFFADCHKLNIRDPKVIAKVTDHIDEQITFVKKLWGKGLLYTTSDGIYFDSSKFPNYNKLSRTPIEQNRAGARVDMGEKKNPNDFAVWKYVDPRSLQKWDDPLENSQRCGCPGWHLECSAIALKYLGQTFDIHTGGVDHIPVHHSNEIAQTESLTGKPMANFWMHNEFIKVDGGKMSKSLGNVYLVEDVEKHGFDPLSLRYLYLLTHYRGILNFTWEGLQAAATAYNNLVTSLAKHAGGACGGGRPAEVTQMKDALLDDLNTPQCIANIWTLLKKPASRAIYEEVIKCDAVLGLNLEKKVTECLKSGNTMSAVNAPAEVVALADKRVVAKANKDFATADKLRAQIEKLGYTIKDTKDGYTITKN